jgi:hypothetical protein
MGRWGDGEIFQLLVKKIIFRMRWVTAKFDLLVKKIIFEMRWVTVNCDLLVKKRFLGCGGLRRIVIY